MSMSKSVKILGSSHNIMRNGLHFTNIALKVKKADLSVKRPTADALLQRDIIPAGTIVNAKGEKATSTGTPLVSDAYGVIYEDIDVTYEQSDYAYVPVVIHGVIDERLMPTAPTAEEKKALTGIQFTDGATE